MLNLKEIFNALSVSLDFTYSGLSTHHKRVAYMAVSLGIEMGLPRETIKDLYIASIIHDIGAISLQEKEKLTKLEVEDPYTHAELGSRLVKDTSFLGPVSEIIRCHHHSWEGGNPCGRSRQDIPLESRIINAVDRLDVLIKPSFCILRQSDGIMQKLKELSGNHLDPDIFHHLLDLASRESFWLDMDERFLPSILNHLIDDIDIYIKDKALIEISLLFSDVIDHKSVFTHKHSRRVAAIAKELAKLLGFSTMDQEKMVVAGLLHDLGKLSVPEEIIEKPGKLTPEEFKVMRKHTYYTYRILDQIQGFEEINQWASFHHERLDGTGYPFRLNHEQISQGSRIMAVSDVFAALAEDRPYREGLPKENIIKILRGMSCTALDCNITQLLLDNFSYFESVARCEEPLLMD